MHKNAPILGALLGVLVLLCGGKLEAVPAVALSGSDADQLFRQDRHWLGGDAALSIPLGNDRVVWLFGDTFIATGTFASRINSAMPRNTIGIQTGLDPRQAKMEFAWKEDATGRPVSFFPEDGDRWFWPGQGVRLEEGPLVIFLHGFRRTAANSLGFEGDGYQVVRIDNPDHQPAAWRWSTIPGLSAPAEFTPGTAVIRQGNFLVGLAVKKGGTHAGAVARFPIQSILNGNLDGTEWWGGSTKGWMAADRLGADGPAVVMDDAGAECSIHWDPRAKRFIHVASYGFGASTIGARTAPELIGPWSEVRTLFRPPESEGKNPFVYAAKAHAEFSTPGGSTLWITYVASSFQFEDLCTPEGQRNLYWPRMILFPLSR